MADIVVVGGGVVTRPPRPLDPDGQGSPSILMVKSDLYLDGLVPPSGHQKFDDLLNFHSNIFALSTFRIRSPYVLWLIWVLLMTDSH